MLRAALLVLAATLPTIARADISAVLGGSSQILSPQQAFAPELATRADGTLELRFTIAPGHYLYRDRLAVVGADGRALAPTLPAGEPYDDAEFGRVTILRGPQRIALGVPAKPGTGIDLSYQGCAEGRLCYAPVRIHLQVP